MPNLLSRLYSVGFLNINFECYPNIDWDLEIICENRCCRYCLASHHKQLNYINTSKIQQKSPEKRGTICTCAVSILSY